MTTFNSRLQLAMLNRKKSHNALGKGFTLVELMIVIVVVGVLSAVAVPQFLGVRDKAKIQASIGEQIGLAKECSSAVLIEGPYPTGCSINGGTFTTIEADVATKCGPTEVAIAAEKSCVITVADDGAITYASSS